MQDHEPTVPENQDTRSLILDATEQIMLTHGYAGVSSRKVAACAGLKSKLLHYYFRTMDDLFIAVFQRLEDRFYEEFARAAASTAPLRSLWALNMDAVSTKLVLEFIALASHRPAIRGLLARSARRDRSMFAAALSPILERLGVDRSALPPDVLALLMAAVARTLLIEEAIGMNDAHASTLEFVEQTLRRLETRALNITETDPPPDPRPIKD